MLAKPPAIKGFGDSDPMVATIRTSRGFEHQKVWKLPTRRARHERVVIYDDSNCQALLAQLARGMTSYCMGEFLPAGEHLENGIAFADPERHRPLVFRYCGADADIACLAHASWNPWHLGYPAEALKRSSEALTLARELSGPIV
jgi:predicted ATPase